MEQYQKPAVLVNNESGEGVYAASGDVTSGDGGWPGCDSQYMRGVYQHQLMESWSGDKGMKEVWGCLGCPAYTEEACGLLTHYADSGYAASYEINAGRNMPAWEYHGCGPDDIVTAENFHDHGNQ